MRLTSVGLTRCLSHNKLTRSVARTYPASGTFTPPQAALYAALLAVQKRLISYCTVSAHISLAQLHRESCALLRRELKNAGLEVSPGTLEGELYPHYVGHPIGVGQLRIRMARST